MADMKALLASVVSAAQAVLPLIVPGSAAALSAGKKVIALIDDTKAMVEGHVDVAELDATRDSFEAAVNAHVEATEAALRSE